MCCVTVMAEESPIDTRAQSSLGIPDFFFSLPIFHPSITLPFKAKLIIFYESQKILAPTEKEHVCKREIQAFINRRLQVSTQNSQLGTNPIIS